MTCEPVTHAFPVSLPRNSHHRPYSILLWLLAAAALGVWMFWASDSLNPNGSVSWQGQSRSATSDSAKTPQPSKLPRSSREIPAEALFRTNDPPPNPRALARITATTEKLKSIIIPEVDFESTTLEEAFAFLEKSVRELDSSEKDPKKRGLNFRIEEPAAPDHPEPGLGPSSPGHRLIRELRLQNVPVVTVLQYMCDSSAIRYRIEEDGVTLLPIGGSESLKLVTRHWHVAPALIEELRFGEQTPELRVDDDPFADTPDPFADTLPPTPDQLKVDRAELSLTDMLKENGISFPEDAAVFYDEATSSLEITNSPSNLDLTETLFTQLAFTVSRERAGP